MIRLERITTCYVTAKETEPRIKYRLACDDGSICFDLYVLEKLKKLIIYELDNRIEIEKREIEERAKL